MSGSTTTQSRSSFNLTEIPSDYRVPGTYIQVGADYSQAGLFTYPARALLVGQMLASGAGIAGQVYPLISADQAAGLFGSGSIAHMMALRWLTANPTMPVDIVALADATAATKATSTITVVRLPVESGGIVIPIGSSSVTVDFNVTTMTTTTLLAAAIAAAINATSSSSAAAQLPVTATSAAAVVTLTAKHGGLCGNDIAYQTPSWPAVGALSALNLTGTSTGSPTSLLSGGTTNPSVAGVFAAIAGTWYTDIYMAWTDATNIAALSTELDRRNGAMIHQDATGYLAVQGTYGTLPTINAAVNGKNITGLGETAMLSPPWEVGATYAAIAAGALNDDPARQLRTLALPGIVAPNAYDRFTPDERNLLLHDGWSTFNVANDGTVSIERAISMYLTNTSGYADTAWLDINKSKVMSRIRYDFRAYVSSVWPRAKLTDDGSMAAEYDPTIATPSRLKASWIARSAIYEQNGWIEESATWGQQAIFERDPNNDDGVLAKLPVKIVGNLITLEAALNFMV